MVGHRKIHSVVDRPDKTHEWNFATGQFMEMQTPSLSWYVHCITFLRTWLYIKYFREFCCFLFDFITTLSIDMFMLNRHMIATILNMQTQICKRQIIKVIHFFSSLLYFYFSFFFCFVFNNLISVTLFFFLFRETLSAENMEYSELSSSGSAC